MARRGVPQRRDVLTKAEQATADLLGPIWSGQAWYVRTPVLCGVEGCGRYAIELDRFAPYHLEASRCSEHASKPLEAP